MFFCNRSVLNQGQNTTSSPPAPRVALSLAVAVLLSRSDLSQIGVASRRKWHPSSSSNSGWGLQELVLTLGMCMLMVLRPIQAVRIESGLKNENPDPIETGLKN
ncbi:hypothetical protein L2E82_20177 [Cichorium intybus]|uniref:Uncharacterized protein n=1 Tax=Cichorium intybus TaxID=13427 RepID=A0ACB9DSV9_CICIN|nr:hypothetical protein L2E82_20177 [Cichorium intybus]